MSKAWGMRPQKSRTPTGKQAAERSGPEWSVLPEETGKKSFWANLQEIDTLLEAKDWIMGKQYTVADPYALVFYGWGVRGEFPAEIGISDSLVGAALFALT